MHAQVRQHYRCANGQRLQALYTGPADGAAARAELRYAGRTQVLEAAAASQGQRFSATTEQGTYHWLWDGRAWHLTVQAADAVAKEVDVVRNCVPQGSARALDGGDA